MRKICFTLFGISLVIIVGREKPIASLIKRINRIPKYTMAEMLATWTPPEDKPPRVS